MENKRTLLITDQMKENIYRDLFQEHGYNTRSWWAHQFFHDENTKTKSTFTGDAIHDYVTFPDENTMIMFMLKFGAN